MNFKIDKFKKAFTPTPKALVRGFTIIEVLIALFILEVGILGVGSLFASSFNIIKTARMETIATNLGSGLMDEMIANSFENVAVGTVARQKYSPDLASPFNNYDYQIDVSYIDGGLNPSVVPTEMKKITVTIYWKIRDNEKTFQIVSIKASH